MGNVPHESFPRPTPMARHPTLKWRCGRWQFARLEFRHDWESLGIPDRRNHFVQLLPPTGVIGNPPIPDHQLPSDSIAVGAEPETFPGRLASRSRAARSARETAPRRPLPATGTHPAKFRSVAAPSLAAAPALHTLTRLGNQATIPTWIHRDSIARRLPAAGRIGRNGVRTWDISALDRSVFARN